MNALTLTIRVGLLAWSLAIDAKAAVQLAGEVRAHRREQARARAEVRAQLAHVESHAKAALRVPASCRHCGHVGEPRDDHSCPCPFSDAECTEHPLA